MKQIHIHGKVFSDYDFKNLVIGGQTNADTIRFVLPKIYADEVDFSQEGWTFSITYVNKDGGIDSALLTKSESIQSENIYLDWTPTITATQVAGKLTCQITCTKKSVRDTEISRFTSKPFSIYVDEYLNQTPITPALPTVIEQALELMAEYNADLQNAIEAGKSAEADASAASGSASSAEQSKNAAAGSATAAAQSESNAAASAKLAERYAKGTEGGVPVSSGEGYQDNAKYYRDKTQALMAQIDVYDSEYAAL